MKKILITMLSIFLVVLTSCNMDASAGIFQSVLASQTIITEPISQIIDFDTNNKVAYMVSQSGLMKFDKNGYTTLLSYSDYPGISNTAFKEGDFIYFRTSKAETDGGVTLKYYKYDITNQSVTSLDSSAFVPAGYEINFVDNNFFYLSNKTDKKVYTATLDLDNDKLKVDSASVVLNYSDIAKASNGVEVRPNYISIASSSVANSTTSTDYSYTNYLIKDDKTVKIIKGLPSTSWKVSGVIKNKDKGWYATAYNSSTDTNDYEIKIYSVYNDGNAKLKISTGISAKDIDLTIGELKGKYFFHVKDKAALYYFDDDSSSISQTSMTNLSSSMDFVASYSDDTSAIIATSQNGFYRLTDVGSSSGFNPYASFN